MTGLNPPEHGVRDNGVASLPAGHPDAGRGSRRPRLPHRRPSSPRASSTGASGWRGASRSTTTRWSPSGVGEQGYPERDAAVVTSAALAWSADAPATARTFSGCTTTIRMRPTCRPATGRARRADERYAGEVAYVDREIGRLLARPAGTPGGRSSRRSVITARCSASTARRSTAFSSTGRPSACPCSSPVPAFPPALASVDGRHARARRGRCSRSSGSGRGPALRPGASGLRRRAAGAGGGVQRDPPAGHRLRLESARGRDGRAVPPHRRAAAGALRPRRRTRPRSRICSGRAGQDARRLQKVIPENEAKAPDRGRP